MVKNLAEKNLPLVALDKSENKRRLNLIMEEELVHSLKYINGDVTDLDSLNELISKEGITHIIHLAALQVPFCAQNPPLGARVNVVGTVNIFEAAKANGISHLAFASSTAVYGMDVDYPEGIITEESALLPNTHYGVYKQANEGSSRIYWQENQISSIGLRPYVAYGPGRDQGMTSTPTVAIYKALKGEPYTITFGGRYCFQYVDDIAKVFIQASQKKIRGTKTFNIGGPSTSSEKIVDEIYKQVPEAEGKLSIEDKKLPFPSEVEQVELVKLLGQIPCTSLEKGIRDTIETFRKAMERGIKIEI